MYDYSAAPVHSSVTLQDITYPFSVYPEFYAEEAEQLAFTGNALIVAVTPRGTISFLLYRNGQTSDEDQATEFSLLPAKYKEAVKQVFEQWTPR